MLGDCVDNDLFDMNLNLLHLFRNVGGDFLNLFNCLFKDWLLNNVNDFFNSDLLSSNLDNLFNFLSDCNNFLNFSVDVDQLLNNSVDWDLYSELNNSRLFDFNDLFNFKYFRNNPLY